MPAAAVALSATALAATDRQTSDFGFDAQQKPGSSAGLHVKIDYVNPADPSAKPPAVQTVIQELAPGAKLDTSVPERCTASDAELGSMGAAACPPGSNVGGGKVTFDSGVGPNRIFRFDVTQFNAADQLILLFVSTEPPGIRVASRARVEGGTITAEVPPIPGGPPDNFTAIDTVDLTLKAVTKDGKHYVTTPPSCAGGSWTNSITFKYRDGQSQTVNTPSPCVASAAGGGANGATPGRKVDKDSPGIARIRGLPRHCRRSDIAARVRTRDSSKLASHTLSVDGRQLTKTTAKRFRTILHMDDLSTGRHTVSIVAVDSFGNRATRSASFNFRRCG